MADLLRADPHVAILNDVVLNQALVRFHPDPPQSRAPGPESRQASDDLTRETIARVQHDGVCWAGGTEWRGQSAMRISISNWSTTEADIRLSADAILQAARAIRENLE